MINENKLIKNQLTQHVNEEEVNKIQEKIEDPNDIEK